ncbi:autotransporter outer membrane beta-barrel domain-containing protein [Limnobacter litoralis]|uniref:Autotransporter domain-containing protein n=1 Tax=Limnobacter litoralis TaxID=481366 RepID=A0ABQ5YWX4_9BURK|nr:autotransporter outer membrane beta-barrel domain-containing protein [Limnobacter litoralis]GLR27418.1 hypothetical protein GCM10007875_25090 [Limnobacter litoralis]
MTKNAVFVGLSLALSTLSAQAAPNPTLDGQQAGGLNGVMVATPLGAIRQHALALENRLSIFGLVEPDAKGEPHLRPVGDVQLYGSAEAGRYKLKEEGIKPGFKAHTQVLNLGGDRMVTRNALVGLGISVDSANTSLENGRGSFDNDLVLGTVFTTIALSPSMYVNGQVNFGRVNYDINRIGSVPGTATGSTSALYQAARIGGGFIHNFSHGITLNPQISYTEEQLKMDGYSETGTSPLLLRYNPTKYKSQRVSLGAIATIAPSTPHGWRPVARFSFEHDLNDDGVVVGVGQAAGGPIQTAKGDQPDRNYELLSLAAIKELQNGGLINLQLATTLGFKDLTSYSLSATYKHPF